MYPENYMAAHILSLVGIETCVSVITVHERDKEYIKRTLIHTAKEMDLKPLSMQHDFITVAQMTIILINLPLSHYHHGYNETTYFMTPQATPKIMLYADRLRSSYIGDRWFYGKSAVGYDDKETPLSWTSLYAKFDSVVELCQCDSQLVLSRILARAGFSLAERSAIENQPTQLLQLPDYVVHMIQVLQDRGHLQQDPLDYYEIFGCLQRTLMPGPHVILEVYQSIALTTLNQRRALTEAEIAELDWLKNAPNPLLDDIEPSRSHAQPVHHWQGTSHMPRLSNGADYA